MILEEETFEAFGYYSSDLKPHSHKRVLAACDNCGEVRKTTKNYNHTLCRSCVQKGNTRGLGYKHTEEAKAKISEARRDQEGPMLDKHHTIETKAKMSVAQKGRTTTEETKAKIGAAHKGEKCYNWQGGIAFEPYCIKFDKVYKQLIRERHGNVCFLCNRTTEENGRALDVHHVNYNKDCGDDGEKCICVPLCRSCHMKTNFDRNYWHALIMEMLKPFEAWM